MKISNTLTGSKSTVKSVIGEDVVGIYVCGVTPYDSAHVGHAMSLMVYDVLIRYLRWRGYEVNFVSNYTDVDDKLIDRARELAIEPLELADRNIEEWEMEQRALGLLVPDVRPRVTQEIDSIIEMIREIIDHGLAYATSDGDVYYRVRSNSDYGKLSHRQVDDLRSGSRLEMDNTKEDPLDFALWKATKPGEPSWASPWGLGRPGWHIECSAMAHKYLGEEFDIHTGGVDNIFPHHEGEIAQSEGSFGKKHVNYWIHGQHLLSEGIKMSKSKQNEYLISDISQRLMDPLAFRYLCLMTNYRTKLNFTFSSLKAAQKGLNRLRHLYWSHKNSSKTINNISVGEWCKKIDNALLNNLNTSKVLSILWQSTKSNLNSAEICYLFEYIDFVLGLDFKKRYLNQNNFKISEDEYKDRKNKRISKQYIYSDNTRLSSIKTNNLKYYDYQNGDYKVKKISPYEKAIQTNNISGSSEIKSNIKEKSKFDISVCLILDEFSNDFKRCLNSVIENIPSNLSYEIIVAINGISDEKIEGIIDDYKVNKNINFIHIDPICGAGSVRNIMIKKSLGEFLFLIDTSIEIKGNIFNQIINDLTNSEIGLIGPFGLKTDDLHHFHEISETKEYVDAIQLYLFAFRRSVINKTGMFRENFRFYRNLDIDFSFQIKKANLKLLSNPNLNIMRHTHSVWENTHPKTRDELSKDNYKRFLQKWKNYKHLLNNSK